jgi:hypothetical protein
MMKPVAAAVAAALISGGAMYTVGAKTATVDAFTQPAAVQPLNTAYAPAAQVVPASFQAARPVNVVTTTPRRTVYRSANLSREHEVSRESRPTRSWQKTAMVIGGSTAGGAGLGGLIGGTKGALIGAALGGGASTIYEASKH